MPKKKKGSNAQKASTNAESSGAGKAPKESVADAPAKERTDVNALLSQLAGEIAAKEAELKEAVKAEEYADAAKLKEEIKSLKKKEADEKAKPTKSAKQKPSSVDADTDVTAVETDGIYFRDCENNVQGPYTPEEFDIIRCNGQLVEYAPDSLWRTAGGNTYTLTMSREYTNIFGFQALTQAWQLFMMTALFGMVLMIIMYVDFGNQDRNYSRPSGEKPSNFIETCMPAISLFLVCIFLYTMRTMALRWRDLASEIVVYED